MLEIFTIKFSVITYKYHAVNQKHVDNETTEAAHELVLDTLHIVFHTDAYAFFQSNYNFDSQWHHLSQGAVNKELETLIQNDSTCDIRSCIIGEYDFGFSLSIPSFLVIFVPFGTGFSQIEIIDNANNIYSSLP